MYAWIVSRSRVSRTGEKKCYDIVCLKKKKKTFFDHENKLQIKNEIRRKDGVGKNLFSVSCSHGVSSLRDDFFLTSFFF